MEQPKMVGQQELVNHPAHYNQGEMEVIDAIEGLRLGFCEGTILKYLARHEFKNDPLCDLEKARWYLTRMIARIKRAGEITLTDEEEEVLGVNKVPYGYR